MEDLNSVKSWEQRLRKEIDGLKSCKDQVLADSAIPKQVKDRFIDVLRTLKMNMIQVLAKCTQLRNESLPAKAMKVRAEKLKFEYEEVTKNLEQLQSTLNAKSSNGHGGFRNQSRDEEIHTVVAKELMEIREIISKTQEDLETHSHQDYEQRIEILESENQDRRGLRFCRTFLAMPAMPGWGHKGGHTANGGNEGRARAPPCARTLLGGGQGGG